MQKILLFLVAFSAGSLIGDAFIHLLPEALAENKNELMLSIAILSGIMLFFLLEKVLRWRHCHESGCEDHPRHLGLMNLIGDGAHNYIDGLLIGASFSVSIPLGIATTIAVILHEIPQELGDFGVLLHSGFSVKKALFFNLLTGLIAILGGLTALVMGERLGSFNAFMLPFTMGGFIYIALSDLIPELHKDTSPVQTIFHIFGIIAGIGVMLLLLLLE